jgi:hypothetical protein
VSFAPTQHTQYSYADLTPVPGLMHERRVSAVLSRRIRNHFSTIYKMRGTTLDLYDDVIRLLPPGLARKLSIELGFVGNSLTGRRGVLGKVPFFQDLLVSDLIMIGCRLSHGMTFPPPYSSALQCTNTLTHCYWGMDSQSTDARGWFGRRGGGSKLHHEAGGAR